MASFVVGTLQTLRRRAVVALSGGLLGSAALAYAGAEAATGANASGAELKLALSALLGVVGISTSLLSLMAAMLRHRERTNRKDLVERINDLEAALDEHEEREERQFESIGHQLNELRRETHDNTVDMRESISAVRSEHGWMAQSLIEVRDQQQEVLRLLRGLTNGARPGQ